MRWCNEVGGCVPNFNRNGLDGPSRPASSLSSQYHRPARTGTGRDGYQTLGYGSRGIDVSLSSFCEQVLTCQLCRMSQTGATISLIRMLHNLVSPCFPVYHAHTSKANTILDPGEVHDHTLSSRVSATTVAGAGTQVVTSGAQNRSTDHNLVPPGAGYTRVPRTGARAPHPPLAVRDDGTTRTLVQVRPRRRRKPTGPT